MHTTSGSTLSSSQMEELLTLSLRESPTTLRKILILSACTCDLVFSVTSQSSWPYMRAQSSFCHNSLVHSFLTREQDPEVLDILHLGQDLLPTWWKLCTFSQSKTMASDLKVLILITAASHLAANWPKDSWRCQTDEGSRTTLSEKAKTRSWGHQTKPPQHHGCT